MKPFVFTFVCMICAAGGVVAGYYSDSPSADKTPAARAFLPPAAVPAAANSLQPTSTLQHRAALILASAARGDRHQLSALVAACAGNPATMAFLCDTWLEIDPAALVKALAESRRTVRSERNVVMEALGNVMERWAGRAPDDAWKCAEGLPGNVRRTLLSHVAGQRLMDDVRSGLEFLKSHPGVAPQMYPVIASPEERAALLPLIDVLPGSRGKTGLLQQALEGLPVAEAMQHLNAHADGMTYMSRDALLKSAAERSLDEVVAYHATASGAERYMAAQAIGSKLLDHDPAAAVRWAEEHLSGSARTAVLKKAAAALEQKQPAAAAAARALLPASMPAAAR